MYDLVGHPEDRFLSQRGQVVHWVTSEDMNGQEWEIKPLSIKNK